MKRIVLLITALLLLGCSEPTSEEIYRFQIADVSSNSILIQDPKIIDLTVLEVKYDGYFTGDTVLSSITALPLSIVRSSVGLALFMDDSFIMMARDMTKGWGIIRLK